MGPERGVIGTVGSSARRADAQLRPPGEGRGWRRQRFGGGGILFTFVTRDSCTKYTPQSRGCLGASPLLSLPHHIGSVPVTPDSEGVRAHRGPKKGVSTFGIWPEPGSSRGVSSAGETRPSQYVRLSVPRSIVGTLSPAPNRRTPGKSGRGRGESPTYFFLEYTT